jgi:hypothetical protein
MPLVVKNHIISSNDITSAGVFKTKVNRDSLICYLDAADVNSYPGNGSTWFDLSGNGYNATIFNGSTYITANNGLIVLNGTNQYINVPIPNLASTNYTIIGAARYGTIGGRIFAAANNNWLLGWWGTTTENYFAEGWVTPVGNGASDSNFRILSGSGNISEDQYTFYVNGNKAYVNQNGAAGPNGINIGRYGPGNSEYSNAYVSYFLAYNRVLSPYEIMEVFQATRGRFGL